MDISSLNQRAIKQRIVHCLQIYTKLLSTGKLINNKMILLYDKMLNNMYTIIITNYDDYPLIEICSCQKWF